MFPFPDYRIARASRRFFIHAAADVRSSLVPGIHVGVIRDISEGGIFFYSDFKPSIGTRVRLSFVSPIENTRQHCEGIVVRVEHSRAGAAPGIALQLTDKNTALRFSA